MSHLPQHFSEMAAKTDRAFQEVADLRGWLESNEERFIALQRIFEACEDRTLQTNESILRVNESLQVADAEQRQVLQELKRQMDDRGEALVPEMKHHLQWTETRMTQLIAKVAAIEERTEQVRQHIHGPGKKTWDVWEVAEARRDFEVMREELTNVKTSGVVTPQMLAESTEPIRHELRQLGERITKALNQDIMGIVESLMQEVKRGENIAKQEVAVMRQDLAELGNSLRRDLSEATAGSDSVKQQEFADAMEAINQELADLANVVSQSPGSGYLREVKDYGASLWVSRLELMEIIQRELAQAREASMTPRGNSRGSMSLSLPEADSRSSNEIHRLSLAVSANHDRTDEMSKALQRLQANVVTKPEAAPRVSLRD